MATKTTKTTLYVVYRYGSNAANQSMTHVMPIGLYEGTGATARERIEDACRQAEDEHTVYSNQYLNAVPSSRVSADDYTFAHEHQQAEAEQRATYA